MYKYTFVLTNGDKFILTANETPNEMASILGGSKFIPTQDGKGLNTRHIVHYTSVRVEK